MSLFQCGKCGCVDNTATSNFGARWKWTNKDETGDMLAKVAGYNSFEEAPDELCCVCSPIYFNEKGGYEFNPLERYKWHGQFERQFWPVGTLKTNHEGNISRVDGKPFKWESGTAVPMTLICNCKGSACQPDTGQITCLNCGGRLVTIMGQTVTNEGP